MLCTHFTGTDDHVTCDRCDACLGTVHVVARPPAVAGLGSAEQQLIADAVASVSRPIGRINLALALRGSKSKAVVAHGLVHIPQYGVLVDESEDAIVATIDQMIRERRLVRRGMKYPTIALPGSQRSTTRGERPRQRTTSITLALDTYRKHKARQLRWKAYMVFQRSVIAAIDQQRPTSLVALERIPGLGPAKIARFGEELLALVRDHADRT
jgi:superfamily II DNA helicase RecQ